MREKGVRICWPIANFVQVIKTRFFVVLELGTIVLPSLSCIKLTETRSASSNRHDVELHHHTKQRSRTTNAICLGVGITRPCIGGYDLLSARAQAYSQGQNQKSRFHGSLFSWLSFRALGGLGLALGSFFGVNGLGGVFSSRSIV